MHSLPLVTAARGRFPLHLEALRKFVLRSDQDIAMSCMHSYYNPIDSKHCVVSIYGMNCQNRSMHYCTLVVIVVIIEHTLAKFTKRLCLTDALIDVRLHEKGKCLSRDMHGTITCTHTDAMGSRPQPACSREFEGLARLECETVRGYGNLRQFTTTSPDVKSGGGRG